MDALIRIIHNDRHTRRYIISAATVGWSVRIEQDDRIVSSASYDDWHRVERAQRAIDLELAELKDAGWREVASGSAYESVS